MDVEEFTPARWFRISLEDGEPLKDSIQSFASDRDVTLGWIQVIGELKKGKIASGYEDSGNEKIMVDLDGTRHVLGIGSVEYRDGELEVHLHGPMGRAGETGTGCWAGEQDVFRGLDVLLVELK